MRKPMAVPIAPPVCIHCPDETTQPQPIMAPKATERTSSVLRFFFKSEFAIILPEIKGENSHQNRLACRYHVHPCNELFYLYPQLHHTSFDNLIQ